MQQRTYPDLEAVKEAVRATIEEKSTGVVISDNKPEQIVKQICLDLRQDEIKLSEDLKNNNNNSEKSWLSTILAEHQEWQGAYEAFNEITVNKKNILINANGSLSKLRVPGLMKKIPEQTAKAGQEIKSLKITPDNLGDATTLVYILLAQKNKSYLEDIDSSLEQQTNAVIKYSGVNREAAFNSIFLALIDLVNNNPLLRPRIPEQLIKPTQTIIEERSHQVIEKPEEKKKSSAILIESKESTILSQKNFITSELEQANEKLKQLEINIQSSKKILQEYKGPELDEKDLKVLEDLKQVILLNGVINFDGGIAQKYQLSEEEISSWHVRSDAQHGWTFNPVANIRYLASWGTVGSIVRSVPYGEYIAGSSVEPSDVMKKLSEHIKKSQEAKKASDELKLFNETKVQLEEFCIQKKNEITVIEQQIKQQEIIQNPKNKLEQELKGKTEKVELTKNKSIKAINESVKLFFNTQVQSIFPNKSKVDESKLPEITSRPKNQYLNILENKIFEIMKALKIELHAEPNSEKKFEILLKSKNELEDILLTISKVDEELAEQKSQIKKTKIITNINTYLGDVEKEMGKVRLQKSWDVTYEIHKFGIKENATQYFFGYPKNRGNHNLYRFEWILYTIGLGCIFTPAKNLLKILTELVPKWLDAHCENAINRAKKIGSEHKFASVVHIVCKSWWVSLRPITSPLVSAKAARETGYKAGEKMGGRFLGLVFCIGLTSLSLFISAVSTIIMMAIVPKAIIGVLGQIGGVVATTTSWFSSSMRPLPLLSESVAGLSYVPTAVIGTRRLLGRQLDKKTASFITQRLQIEKQNVSSIPKTVDQSLLELNSDISPVVAPRVEIQIQHESNEESARKSLRK